MIQPFFSTPILDIVVDEELETRDVYSNEVHIMFYAAGSNHSSWAGHDKTASDLPALGHKTRENVDYEFLLSTARCNLVAMLQSILLLILVICVKTLRMVSTSSADYHAETVSHCVVAVGHAVETWPFWMLSTWHLPTLKIQVAPASCQEEGFEIIFLRLGADSSEGSYVELPIINQVLRRGFLRSKKLTRFEIQMKRHRIGSLHVRNRKAVVFINPLSSVAEVEDEIEHIASGNKQRVHAPRKKANTIIAEERMFPEPLRLVFNPVGDVPCAPRKKANKSSCTLPEPCILFPCPEEEPVQSTADFFPRKRRRIEEKQQLPMQMPGSGYQVVGDQIISPPADVELIFLARATAVEKNEAAFIVYEEHQEQNSTPEFYMSLEEQKQVPGPSLVKMHAKVVDETDNSTIAPNLALHRQCKKMTWAPKKKKRHAALSFSGDPIPFMLETIQFRMPPPCTIVDGKLIFPSVPLD